MEFKKLIQDSEHKINDELFSLRTLKHIYESKGFTREGIPLGFEDAKRYMLKFLFPVESGIILNSGGNLQCKSMDTMNKTYFGRMDKKLKEWYKGNTLDIYKRVCIPNRQLIVGNTINTIGSFAHKNDMKYSECSAKAKKGVERVLEFILDVWCSYEQDQSEYILNWIANMIQGNKNKVILYAKTISEGVGKSTLSDFLREYVLGERIATIGDNKCISSGNNHSLYGKVLVVFEELASTMSEWHKVSSALKQWASGDTANYNEKYMVGFSGVNINNYMINTNTEAVKGANGRRYFICDISTKYKGDHEYWSDLNNVIMNNEVGKAFYLYMLERDISKFASHIYPVSKKKKEYISELLHPVHKFLKFNYLLYNKCIENIPTRKMLDDYNIYANNRELKPLSIRKFNDAMREINLSYTNKNSKTYWNVSLDELKLLAERRGWLCDTDGDEIDIHLIWKDKRIVKNMAGANNLFIESKQYEDIINKQKEQLSEQKEQLSEQQKQIEELKKQLAELQKVNDIPEPAPDTPNLFKKKKSKSKKKKSKRKKSKKSKSKKKKKVVKKKNDKSAKLDAWETIKTTIKITI